MQTITRNELKESFEFEIQRKKKENEAYLKKQKEDHLARLDCWVQQHIYEPIKRAAKDGHTAFQWQMNSHGKSKDDWEYIMQKINTLFPDCDLHTSSFEEQTILRNPPVCTIRWG